MSGGQGDEHIDEPEETMPFTHRAYGSGEPDNPFTSPSGTASQAVAGVAIGVIGSVGGVLVIMAVVAFAVLIGSGWSWV